MKSRTSKPFQRPRSVTKRFAPRQPPPEPTPYVTDGDGQLDFSDEGQSSWIGAL